MATYNASNNTLSLSLPANLRADAEKLKLDWNKLIAAIEQYGIPLVTGVVAALQQGGIAGFLALIPLIQQYGIPLVQAVIAALQS